VRILRSNFDKACMTYRQLSEDKKEKLKKRCSEGKYRKINYIEKPKRHVEDDNDAGASAE